MAWTKKQIFLAVLLVFTGSINTISTKWASLLEAESSDGKTRKFNHPFFQSCCMFLGEFSCLVVFKAIYYSLKWRQDGSEDEHDLVKGNRNFNPFIFLPPAMCDMIATSLMYVGLNLTYASSFQMLRGSSIVFVALLSVIFLQRKVTIKMWAGILLVLAGAVVVGLCDVLFTDQTESNNEVIGDIIIVCSQVVVAIQMVLEEKFVNGKDIPPLQAVGWEGFFGFTILALLMFPFYYIHVGSPWADNAHEALEDIPDAFYQIYSNNLLILSIIGTIVSIAFFNFAGISVTKEMSATTRMVLDSIRMLTIYLFSLYVRWQSFHGLQILGFLLLILGMAVYNNLIPGVKDFVTYYRRRSSRSLVVAEDE